MTSHTAIDATAKTDTTPWYRQFWPWFLIVLPGAVVVASFYMLYLAINYSDTLVSDNYYRDGLAINLVLSQDVRATELGLVARLVFGPSNTEGESILALNLTAKEGAEWLAPDKLTLQVIHPTNADADRMMTLIAAGNGRYRAESPVFPEHRFYLRVIPGLIVAQEQTKFADWRLTGEFDFSTGHIVELSAP